MCNISIVTISSLSFIQDFQIIHRTSSNFTFTISYTEIHVCQETHMTIQENTDIPMQIVKQICLWKVHHSSVPYVFVLEHPV
jgi:hypothetical protein